MPWAGKKSRLTCPNCDRPHCFRPYVDTETGQLLPDIYGMCDHEVSCNYKLSPYSRPAGGGLSYATATERNDEPQWSPLLPTPRRAVLAACPVDALTIPADVYAASLGHYEANTLAVLLREHFGWGIAAELLQRFHLGTSAHWPGACVFWLLDEQGRARGGQVVLYDATGHTVKTPHRHTTWAHTALSTAYTKRGEAAPSWLSDYAAHAQKSPCLFGLPQLTTAPLHMPVALVESAKTAILATPYAPRFIWLATMGLSYLTAERLEPLRGRRIVLFPDAGAYEKWQTKAISLQAAGFNISVSAELETTATEAERAAGLDVADVLLREWQGYPPNWDDLPPRPAEPSQATLLSNAA
ncbi:DUF6371 domain-containing protein [Hymenobacter segetis]